MGLNHDRLEAAGTCYRGQIVISQIAICVSALAKSGRSELTVIEQGFGEMTLF
jgi:hypothetical protein